MSSRSSSQTGPIASLHSIPLLTLSSKTQLSKLQPSLRSSTAISSICISISWVKVRRKE